MGGVREVGGGGGGVVREMVGKMEIIWEAKDK